MADDILIDFGPVEDKMQGIIKVIGVGGGKERPAEKRWPR